MTTSTVVTNKVPTVPGPAAVEMVVFVGRWTGFEPLLVKVALPLAAAPPCGVVPVAVPLPIWLAVKDNTCEATGFCVLSCGLVEAVSLILLREIDCEGTVSVTVADVPK